MEERQFHDEFLGGGLLVPVPFDLLRNFRTFAQGSQITVGGLIVNISSSGAQEYAWHVAYGVGKCALDRITARHRT